MRIERGNLAGVSPTVWEGLARALRLDAAERTHLLDLARNANAATTAGDDPITTRIRPSVQRLLDSIGAPARVRNARGDLLAANQLGFALYSEILADDDGPPNMARFTFLNPRARRFFPDWERSAANVVAVMRSEAGRHPHDPGLTSLIEELSLPSTPFRELWAAHDVQLHSTGPKLIYHPVVSDLELAFEAMELTADPGLTLVVYNAEPGSATHDALQRLGNGTLADTFVRDQAAKPAAERPAPAGLACRGSIR